MSYEQTFMLNLANIAELLTPTTATNYAALPTDVVDVAKLYFSYA